MVRGSKYQGAWHNKDGERVLINNGKVGGLDRYWVYWTGGRPTTYCTPAELRKLIVRFGFIKGEQQT